MLVRPMWSTDVEAVHRVHAEAFGQEAEAVLVEALRALPDADPSLSLVADLDGEVVGHVHVHPVDVEEEGGRLHPALALAPIGVLPAHQRSGIGTALMEAVLDACAVRPEGVVIVLGHPAYYARFGFAPARALGIECPFELPAVESGPEDPWMALPTRPRAHEGVRGTVRYPAPFHAPA